MATTYLADAEQATVAAAVTAANTGDTLVLPVDTATWSSVVSIPAAKNLSIIGAGDTTVITGGGFALSTSVSRISACKFIDATITAYGHLWRIDHCTFANTVWEDVIISTAIVENTYSKGLVDNCIFSNVRLLANGHSHMLNVDNSQHYLCARLLGLGTDDAVYIEDCVFTNTGEACLDSNYAGKYVIRHCTFNNCRVEGHSVQGTVAVPNRSIRKWEIYENSFVGTGGNWVPIFLRGGTGVCFNNTVTGDYDEYILLDNRRCDENLGPGYCDGGCNWDENTAGENGWRCRDQIGTGIDASQWSPGEVYAQAEDPAYFWNNLKDAVAIYPQADAGSAAWIQVNRDYYLSEKPGYVPYTYPHPLRGEKFVLIFK